MTYWSRPLVTDGSFIKTGPGYLIIAGRTTAGGDVTVAGGALAVDGTLTLGTSLNIASGGTLAGFGWIYGNTTVEGSLRAGQLPNYSDLIANNSGRLPVGIPLSGTSPGTLTFYGNVALAGTATTCVNVDGTLVIPGGPGTYDKFISSGSSANFQAGGTLAPVLRNIPGGTNSYTPGIGTTFPFLTVTNGATVTGSYTSLTQPASGLPAAARFDALYSPAGITLVVTPRSYAGLAATQPVNANLLGLAGALDRARPVAGQAMATSAKSRLSAEPDMAARGVCRSWVTALKSDALRRSASDSSCAWRVDSWSRSTSRDRPTCRAKESRSRICSGEKPQGMDVAATEPEALLGQDNDAAAFRGLVGQGGELGCVGQFGRTDSGSGQKLGSLAIAQGDGAGLVQKQHVHVAGGLHGPAGHGLCDTSSSASEERGAMEQVVIENPVINSPFSEPTRHFRFNDDGITNEIIEERRESACFVPIPRPRKKSRQLSLLADTEWMQDRYKVNELVNNIRYKVGLWRRGGYAGVTSVTSRLLAYWTAPEREKKLFFCQIEALETLIYITEVAFRAGDQWIANKLREANAMCASGTAPTGPTAGRRRSANRSGWSSSWPMPTTGACSVRIFSARRPANWWPKPRLPSKTG